MDHHISD